LAHFSGFRFGVVSEEKKPMHNTYDMVTGRGVAATRGNGSPNITQRIDYEGGTLMCSKKRLLIFVALLAILLSPLKLLPAQEITVDWIYSDEGQEPTKIPRFVWTESGKAILYDTRKPKEERTLEWLDPATGARIPAIKRDKTLDSLSSLREKQDEENIDTLLWPSSFDRAGRYGVFLLDDDLFLLEIGSSRFYRLTTTAAQEKSPRFSPDGNHLAFVRDNDLHVYDITAKTEKRLTQDGSETLLNGTVSWVYWEEVFGRLDIGYWWSEDSGAIAFLQTDESPVSVMHYIDFKPALPRVVKQRYPKTGEINPVVRLGIVELASGRLTWMDPSEIPYEYLVRVKWLPNSRRLCLQALNRMQTRLDLHFMDRDTGEMSHVMTETDPAWVNVHDDLHFLDDGKHFIWASERDGYAHLYRYAMDGELVNQITRGEWSIRASSGVYWVRQGVSAIDEKEGWLYFTALEKSSIERHLYRIRFDGSGMERLTREDGTHRIAFSPDGRYYFDSHSNSSTLPALTLHTSDGAPTKVIAPPRQELLSTLDIQYPEFLTVPAEDGFAMPAQILKPKDFDTAKKYPAILNVYGGPAAPTVNDSWSSAIYWDQILLRNGFLVMRVDGRSATGISKKLESLVLNEMMGDLELNELVAAVRWLKSQPFVDPDRVGLWGWSGGGTFTLLAMTRSKEFKAGISVAPVTDWHYYDTKFGETYMKTPLANPDGYEKTSLVKRAKDIHGRLLLVHGTYDDNVHPQNSWHFIDEMIEAGKNFDMMFYPMRQHGISDRPARKHLYKKMLEFWKTYL
jgi:dipeptidyl-peptidase-4